MLSTMDYKILENTIDKLKAKYVSVVKELCLEHLRIFDKSRYIEQIAAEMRAETHKYYEVCDWSKKWAEGLQKILT